MDNETITQRRLLIAGSDARLTRYAYLVLVTSVLFGLAIGLPADAVGKALRPLFSEKLAVGLPADAVAQTLPPGFSEEIVFSGLTEPTAVEFASDGRVFVAEKSGLIKVFSSLSATVPTVFADLRTKVHNYWDRGLLGMALHPNFPTTPNVYVLYAHDAAIGGTAPRWGTVNGTVDSCPTPPGPTSDGCVVSGRLSRLVASGDVMTGTEQVLLEGWCQQYPSHSIGSIAFGPDGALYISGGDGASFTFVDYGQDGSPVNPCGDPPSGVGGVQSPPTAEGGSLRSQSIERPSNEPRLLNGAILRVDPETGDALPDNPLVTSADANERRAIAYGLRNPFRMTIRPGTSEVWVGDVGWTNVEEINRIVSPTGGVENFGWPCYEGVGVQTGYEGANLNICESLYNQSGAVTPPTYSYFHADQVVAGEDCPAGSSAISGLAFYNGGSYPAGYDGALFFADYSRGCIWTMFNPTGGSGSTPLLAYAFDEGAGSTSADLSGHNRPASLVGGATWSSAGVHGNAVQLNGTNAYVSVADPGIAGGDFTVSTWVFLTRNTVFQTVMEMLDSSSVGWELDLEVGGKITLWSNGIQRLLTGATVPLNSWTYLTLRRTGATWEIFINGVAQPETGADGTIFDFGNCPFSIGVDADSGCTGNLNGYLQGRIDDARVYDRALTAAEIQADKDAAVTPTTPTPSTSIETFVAQAAGPVQLTIGPNGDLFYVDFNNGTIRRIRHGTNQAPTAVAQATPTSGSAPLTVTFDGLGSSDPDAGDTITYAWDLDGDGQFDDSTAAQPVTTYTVDGTYTVRLRVTDNNGAASVSNNLVIIVGIPNSLPTATINEPLATTTWKVGDVINFSGQANDPEDGSLPPSALSWTLILHHCPSNCHTHPLTDFVGVASGSFAAPDHDYPSHIEVQLTATDSRGATDVKSVLIYPQPVALTFQSNPSGLQLTVGSSGSVTPFDRTVIVGSANSVSAPSPQTLGGSNYQFVSWSDGGAQSHNLTAGETPTTYTANYQSTTITAFPSSTTILTGTLSSGTAAALVSDNDVYYAVNSTTSGTRTAAWYGSFSGVSKNLTSLQANYKGKNSKNCTQTIAIWRWTTSAWVQLDSRTVGTTEIAINNLVPTGTLADYVSGTTDSGEARVRIQCQATANFTNRGDLMSIVYDAPIGPPPPPPSGALLAYGFNEGSGTTSADLSGNNHPATLVGGVTWTSASVAGNAVQLNGTDAYVSVADPGMPGGDFTASAWVFLTGNSGFQTVMEMLDSSSVGWELDLEVGGKITLWSNGIQRLLTGATVPLNTWTYLTLRRTGAVWEVFINGVAQPETGADGTIFAFGNCPFSIGVDADIGCTGALNGYLQGRIDEVRVYDRALTATEIQADRASPL